jgi:hypothetical protein
MLADAGADIAVVYCGSVRDDPERGVRQKLYVLDVDVVYFHPGLFGELAARLRDMGARWRVRAAAIFAPEHLAAQVAGLGVMVEVVPNGVEGGRRGRGGAEVGADHSHLAQARDLLIRYEKSSSSMGTVSGVGSSGVGSLGAWRP